MRSNRLETQKSVYCVIFPSKSFAQDNFVAVEVSFLEETIRKTLTFVVGCGLHLPLKQQPVRRLSLLFSFL